MRSIRFHAALVSTGVPLDKGTPVEGRDPALRVEAVTFVSQNPENYAGRFPVFLTIWDARDGEGEESVGYLRLGVQEAGLLKSILELLGSLAPSDRLAFRWSGWEPPPTNLPMEQIRRVLRLVGLGGK